MDSLILLLTTLIAAIGVLAQAGEPADALLPCESGATAVLGDDPVSVAVLCGGVTL